MDDRILAEPILPGSLHYSWMAPESLSLCARRSVSDSWWMEGEGQGSQIEPWSYGHWIERRSALDPGFGLGGSCGDVVDAVLYIP